MKEKRVNDRENWRNKIKLFNTLTRRKNSYLLKREKVREGMSADPYNLIHIGNARPMIIFDTVRRYME